MTDDDLQEVDSVVLNLTLRDSDSCTTLMLREVALGMTPIIIIEPSKDQPDDALAFDIDATDLDRDGLAQCLELILYSLRGGPSTEAELALVRVRALADDWDAMTKGASPSTTAIRAAIEGTS